MVGKKIVLITGVAGCWGARVAEKLLAIPEYHVVGLDSEKPEKEIKGLDFIQADIRNPLLVDLFKSENVDTVCHLTFMDSICPSEVSFDTNVMGMMKVLGASAEAGVRKVVLKSSMMVYGAKPANSAFLNEQHPLKGGPEYGYVRDLIEIEAFCNGFRRQVPGMTQTILRFSSIVGPSVDTPMTCFLREPWTPVLLGFDPMMQVIHEDDVVDALVHAVVNDVPGAFNVAAEGVLPLTKLMGLAGKLAVPIFHLFAYWGVGMLSGNSIGHLVPMGLDYLRYAWVGDLTRMREELCFTPRYTAEEALREFAGKQRLRGYLPESKVLAYDEERLRDTIERRRRFKARQEMHRSDSSLEGEIHE